MNVRGFDAVVGRDDVGMAPAGHHFRFTGKPSADAHVTHQVRVQCLDGHRATARAVGRAVDDDLVLAIVLGVLALSLGAAVATRGGRRSADERAGFYGTGKTMWDSHACPGIEHR